MRKPGLLVTFEKMSFVTELILSVKTAGEKKSENRTTLSQTYFFFLSFHLKQERKQTSDLHMGVVKLHLRACFSHVLSQCLEYMYKSSCYGLPMPTDTLTFMLRHTSTNEAFARYFVWIGRGEKCRRLKVHMHRCKAIRKCAFIASIIK